jgi:hypothetical protein
VESVALRIRYLSNLPIGAESHAILVQDIPGVRFGTAFQRADATFLAPFPAFMKDPVSVCVCACVRAALPDLLSSKVLGLGSGSVTA